MRYAICEEEPLEAVMTTNGQEHRGHPFLIGLLAGGALGAGLAILLAPRLASELRERVEGSARDLRKKARAFRDDVCDAVVRGAEEVERRATEAKRH